MDQHQPGRRAFLGNIAKAGMIGLLPAGVKGASLVKPAGIQLLTAPYLQQLTTDSVVIRWITDQPASSWVEYGETTPDKKALPPATLGLLAANSNVHEVKIAGLQPGTKYTYRVCSRQIADFQPYTMTWGTVVNSQLFQFSTLAANPAALSWLVLNDIHDRPSSFAHLYQFNGKDPFEFVFLNGDMFDYQTDEQQLIDHLLTPLTALFASEKPFLYARGNHETRGKYARQLADYFNNPGNQFYFSLTRGPVHFIVLDTGEDKEDDHAEYSQLVAFDEYRREQARWLEKALAEPACVNAPFRVVMMHIPVFHSGEGHGSKHCRELFNPLFNKAGIDLMICGHTHRYGVHPPDAATHNYPLIIGGGPKEGKRTLIKVKANRTTLVLQMLGDDGSEVGNYTVTSKR